MAGKHDEVFVYDVQFGQYFYTTLESIDAAVNKINYQMFNSQYVSLNDFYDELGIDRIDIGDNIGWNISRHGLLEVSHNETTMAKNGKPCVKLEYHVLPEYNYYKN